jgi:ATP-dependent DNA ligase
MLARTYGPKFSSFPCFVQPKLNGVRALYQNGTFVSRDEKFWKPGVLAHLVAELQTLPLGDTILDGELYVHGWKLGRINGAVAVNRKEPIPDTLLVEYHVFDVVDDKKNFGDRWSMKQRIQINDAKSRFVRLVPTRLCMAADEADSYFRAFVADGYEGIMLRPDGPYEFGQRWSARADKYTEYRSPFLWKKKQWEDAEFRCVGTTVGLGKASIGIGAFVFETYLPGKKEIVTWTCGTGLDDNERIHWAENDPTGLLVRVRYPYLSEDGIPQCPSFVAVMQ